MVIFYVFLLFVLYSCTKYSNQRFIYIKIYFNFTCRHITPGPSLPRVPRSQVDQRLVLDEHGSRNPDGQGQTPRKTNEPIMPGVKPRLLVHVRVVVTEKAPVRRRLLSGVVHRNCVPKIGRVFFLFFSQRRARHESLLLLLLLKLADSPS